MELSFVLPAFNEQARLPAALASIRQAAAEAGAPSWEIVVCDNNSTDGTGAAAAEAGARVVFEPHNQIARARNAGAKAATGTHLIFMDADSRLSPELLRETLAVWEEGAAAAGGALVAFDRTDVGWHARAGLAGWNVLSRACGLAAGSYMYCPRKAWEETGGFDETVYAGEELAFSIRLRDWCRARGLGFRILSGARLETSARKIDQFSPWNMVVMMTGLLLPSARRRADKCAYWYDPALRESEKSG